MTSITLPVVKKQVSIGTLILVFLAALGAFAAMFRWVDGFSHVSNLSDSRPWGIWISFDLLVGVPISAGAFVLAATVHIFHIEKYRPILRPALLTGFLGYLMVILALLVDLGQPQRIWHMLVYWNLHSPLFEVGMCVMTYTAVLFLEFSPPLLEKLGWTSLLQFVKKISIPVVILGVTLSTMHQSSLGSLFLIVPFKMHPLWYTSLLPLIFLVSAIAVGFGMVIFECAISHQVFGGQVRNEIFQGLARGMLITLGLLLLIKVGDLAYAGELGLIFSGTFQGNMFILENLIGIILPIAILLVPKFRKSSPWIFRAGLLTLLGLILYRLNIGLVSMAGEPYVPHVLELAVTIGLFSAGIMAFGFAMKNLPLEEDPCTHVH
ncbi:MAG: Ni/Fe-hydrogenase cytochrome b subunit [Chloroflexi bacterium]|nr:Ni/Fe-hydrogenase cytochrome b subunit [Chloroflexota bacterium]